MENRKNGKRAGNKGMGLMLAFGLMASVAGPVQAEKLDEAPVIDAGFMPADRDPDQIGGVWKKEGTGWWFCRQDGTWPAGGWEKIGQHWYYFDRAGFVKTGWLCKEDKWYYLDPAEGQMVLGWQKLTDQTGTWWFYFRTDGQMAQKWVKVQGIWYYLEPGSGHMKTGWLSLPEGWYYLKENGAMAVNETIGGYFFNDQGLYVPVSTVPFTKNGIAVVNKKYGLPQDYAPGENGEAGQALRRLIRAMQNAGYNISNDYSGFRSYETQSYLYWNYVAGSGQAAADTFSARPGYSEHQTGLAFDLKHWNGQLVTNYAEASWIAAHAHEYGFIVRYQAGWEAITGYMAEPWHIRYVGSAAADIYRSGLPLETWLQVEGGDYR